MNEGRTRWFPGNIKPARPGVYEREWPTFVLFAEWTGYQWLIGHRTVRGATTRRLVSNQQDTIRWRGLAHPPR